MTIWTNSKMTTLFYSDQPATTGQPCSVKIDDTGIVVNYEASGVGQVQYKGPKNEDGHFELRAPEVQGLASLHMFPGSSILEGHWREEGIRGMWRIDLGEPTT